MRYYNLATGETRVVPDEYEEVIENQEEVISQVQTIIPKEGRYKKNTNYNFLNLFGIERIDFSNLNFDYIVNNLDFDDLLLIGLIILLLSSWTEDDIYLVIVLVFILISEWVIVPNEHCDTFAA